MGVRLVAGFQMFKAAILLGIALLLHFSPQMVTTSERFVYALFYLAMRGNVPAMQAALQGGSLLPGIIGCLGLYLAFLGMGLLSMKGWARRALLFASGATVVLYAKSVLMAGGAAELMGFRAQPIDPQFHALVLLDAIVFVYFLRGTTAQSFQARAARLNVRRPVQLS
jgi:hypothetical protein